MLHVRIRPGQFRPGYIRSLVAPHHDIDSAAVAIHALASGAGERPLHHCARPAGEGDGQAGIAGGIQEALLAVTDRRVGGCIGRGVSGCVGGTGDIAWHHRRASTRHAPGVLGYGHRRGGTLGKPSASKTCDEQDVNTR